MYEIFSDTFATISPAPRVLSGRHSLARAAIAVLQMSAVIKLAAKARRVPDARGAKRRGRVAVVAE